MCIPYRRSRRKSAIGCVLRSVLSFFSFRLLIIPRPARLEAVRYNSTPGRNTETQNSGIDTGPQWGDVIPYHQVGSWLLYIGTGIHNIYIHERSLYIRNVNHEHSGLCTLPGIWTMNLEDRTSQPQCDTEESSSGHYKRVQAGSSSS
ncbi:hypothetical protein EDD16DRAFT_1732185 [Pisolithus croceorrhizus]|nr:hypothetical protein EDD16DRAFT_1732185 [Pisolithus croceorrhizus]